MKKSNPKNVNRKNTKRVILICSILLSVFICAGILSIHAYFTDRDSVSNNFTVGNNVIDIIDKNKVIVKNTPDDDNRAVLCYIRVFVAMEQPGVELPMTSPDLDTTNWTYGNDDYYYYNFTVAPNDETEPLFPNGVSGATSDNQLIVYAESIQAEAIVDESEGEGAYEAFNNQNN